MSMIDRRRLLLSIAGIKNFIIFDTALRAGSVLDSLHAQISVGGYMSIKGTTVTSSNTVGYSGDVYSSMSEVLASLGSQRDYVTKTFTQTNSQGHTTYFVVFTTSRNIGGSLEIGSYDFTKYKKLKFTVVSYAAGGSLSFGSESIKITAAGEYSVDIKDLKGAFNLKFSSNGESGYTVNNVYLEG